MLRRCPDLILFGAAGILVLRGSLWVVQSGASARFLVVTLFPLWVILEIALVAGAIACAYSLVRRRDVTLFGQPIDRRTVVPIALLGLTTMVLEAALWLYGSGVL